MSTIKATTLSNLAGSKTVPTDTVVDGSAKAWVNFNGTGTVAIRRAFNVSSITDNGTGDYTINFTNAMVDANYAAMGVANYSGGVAWVAAPKSGGTKSASALQILAVNNGAIADLSNISVSVFR